MVFLIMERVWCNIMMMLVTIMRIMVLEVRMVFKMMIGVTFGNIHKGALLDLCAL